MENACCSPKAGIWGNPVISNERIVHKSGHSVSNNTWLPNLGGSNFFSGNGPGSQPRNNGYAEQHWFCVSTIPCYLPSSWIRVLGSSGMFQLCVHAPQHRKGWEKKTVFDIIDMYIYIYIDIHISIYIYIY